VPPSDTFADFAAAVTRPDRPVPAGVTSASGRAVRRFAVYRNNVAVGLIEAIGARFPVTRRLLGEDAFRPLARSYVMAEKPDTPVLLHYGRSFPDLLDRLTGPRPDLAAIARIESDWLDAYHAAEADPLALDAVAVVPAERLAAVRLRPHPAARLLEIRAGAAETWAAAVADPGVLPPPAPDGGLETVLITRPHADVAVTVLPPSDAAFAAALLGESTLGAAADAAAHPAFEFGRALVGLVSLGAFAGLHQLGDPIP
jgi:hypothetical protein